MLGAKVFWIPCNGEVRSWWTASLSTTPAYKLADYTFTGQFSYMDDPSTAGTTEGFGLLFYNARWYDPALGRFAQADTIVPGGVQGLDRYAYVNNRQSIILIPVGILQRVLDLMEVILNAMGDKIIGSYLQGLLFGEYKFN